MASSGRKRKGGPRSSSSRSVVGRNTARKRSCGDAIAGNVAKKAEAATAADSAGPVESDRGLKRKHGCVDTATRKKLEDAYTLGPVIGRGNFGSVCICRSNATGEYFACKTLLKMGGGSAAHREVEIMQHLSGHGGVVTLKEVFEDQLSFHLVMEMCWGGHLLDRMAVELGGTFSEQRAAIAVKEIVSAIKYCHDMGVVHRDVKLENILVTCSGHLKLADFGLAARLKDGQKLRGFVGTAPYMAPEVFHGQDYSEKVDIWAVGVVLLALVLGVLPFHGDSYQSVFQAIKNNNDQLIINLHGGLSHLARDLLSRLLDRDASTRLTADQILAHPWIVFYTGGCPSAQPPPTSSSCTDSRKRRKLFISGDPSRRPYEEDVYLLAAAMNRLAISESKYEEDVNVLAAAMNRVTISESKPIRPVCRPASRVGCGVPQVRLVG